MSVHICGVTPFITLSCACVHTPVSLSLSFQELLCEGRYKCPSQPCHRSVSFEQRERHWGQCSGRGHGHVSNSASQPLLHRLTQSQPWPQQVKTFCACIAVCVCACGFACACACVPNANTTASVAVCCVTQEQLQRHCARIVRERDRQGQGHTCALVSACQQFSKGRSVWQLFKEELHSS